MWRNYLTVAYRALAKNKTYAFINIFGLALGLAACLLILLYVRYETSYDKWLPGSDRLYQVQTTWHEVGQPVKEYQSSSLPVRETIAGGFPQIEAVTIAEPVRVSAILGNQPAYVDALFVDPAFFEMFQLDFAQGSRAQALPNVQSVVLTEKEALRQFGTADAVGKTLVRSRRGERMNYVVTGVLKDLPKNSHLDFAALFRFDMNVYNDIPEDFKGWGTGGYYHYVKLRPGADVAAINAALPAWEKRIIPPQVVEGRVGTRADVMDLKLVNVGDIHLGRFQLGAMTPGNDARTIATFSVVAVLILVMASINFINLSTARASQRAREVALRKVLGATRRQLIGQFLGESLLMVAVAMLLALALVELVTPAIAAFLDANLRFRYFGADGFLLPALGLVALVGVAGGLYPALYLSSFQPASVLKANKSAADAQGSGSLRNILVVTQFAISIGLIICTAIVYSQTRFVESFDPGFERDGLIQVEEASRFHAAGNFDAFKREVAALPGVAGVAGTSLGVAATGQNIQSVQAPGAPEGLNIGAYAIDADFFETMGMRILAGRPLGDRYANDRVTRAPGSDEQVGPALAARGLNLVVNRKAAALLGHNDPAAAVGAQVKISVDSDDMVPATIVGVVEDTRIRTARDEIEPLMFRYDPADTRQAVIRYRAARPSDVIAGVRRVWSKFLPDIPFEGAFAEDLVAEQYERERARGAVFATFAGLAIIISCLGLFGLAAFTTERRTKEIGIRKVVGATVRDIVQLLAWQFSKPVIVANLIAWPVAWWVMRDWLNTFDARIALTPGPFVLAGALALAIAVGTIASHALKVARANPILALRYE
jgi:putative ABC transport system permease protein